MDSKRDLKIHRKCFVSKNVPLIITETWSFVFYNYACASFLLPQNCTDRLSPFDISARTSLGRKNVFCVLNESMYSFCQDKKIVLKLTWQ